MLLDEGREIRIRWPAADVLLNHNSADPALDRIVHLAGGKATDLVEVLLVEDPMVTDLVAADLEEFFGCTQAHRIVSLLDRYEVPISNDLAETFRIDLDDLHRGRIVPDLLMARIDGLPRHSRLSEALAQDDELAAQLIDPDEDADAAQSASAVRHTEFTPEVEALSIVVDRLGALISVIGAVVGSNINLPPAPRPSGAAARLRAQREDEQYDDLLADVDKAQERWSAQQLPEPEEA